MTMTTRTRPYDSRKTSSERGTINGVTVKKYGTMMETTPSDSRDRPPSLRYTDKQASTYWYIEKLRQHMHNDTDDI